MSLVRHVGGFIQRETWTLLKVGARQIQQGRVQQTALIEVEFKTTAGELERRLWKVISWPPRFEPTRLFDEDTYSSGRYASAAARDGKRI